MRQQQIEFYKLFAEHGFGDARVCITPKEIIVLTHIALTDLGLTVESQKIHDLMKNIASKGLFNITPEDIDSLPDISKEDCFAFMEASHVTDINHAMFLYVKNLCALYRRRVKYFHIMKSQPFPNKDQIVPRSLLEYGSCKNSLLANWLEWRKWIFDIDNRSAQETGYVFEPILASCLGGTPISASKSPVKRIDSSGNATHHGRQIDCYIEDSSEVYELKMRVTIAASGQGRFNEEMSFPIEAQKAGLTPILVVFDETGSTLLSKLKQQYLDCNGQCFIGKEAWNMLRNRAGQEMGIFIDKYIYPPINAMELHMNENPKTITLLNKDGQIIIKGEEGEYTITRNKEKHI